MELMKSTLLGLFLLLVFLTAIFFVTRRIVVRSTRDLRIARDEAEESRKDMLRALRESDKAHEGLTNTSKLLVQRDAQLTRVNEELTHLNEAKSQFISAASHQLRTPISTINWQTERILGGAIGDLTQKQHDTFMQIRNSVRHMSELIDTLLMMSKLELGTADERNELFDFSDILKETFEDLALDCEEKDITFVQDICSDDTLCSDRNLIQSIVLNLISNAIKYTPANGSIKISAHRNLKKCGGREFEEGNFCIEVSDTGYGIPKDQQHKIFDRLFRAENAIDRNIKGSGLGLYIVELMTKKLGGQVWFTSVENQGTQFYVMIPQSKEVSGVEKTADKVS